MAVHVDPNVAVHQLTVVDFGRMVEAGVFDANDRVELIDGVLVETSPHSPEHARAIRVLNELAVPAAVKVGLQVSPQLSLDIASPLSLPEPDVAITPPATRGDHARAAVLVVEVALSSLRFDLGRKASLYAQAGIPEYWVLDLAALGLVVHRGPRPQGYAEVRHLGKGDRITALALPLSFTVGELL